ncbi:TetR/AcrR family transcriptional regulator [Pseudonocardia dioxanivorans]|uniref:TetR/AcrR family transcriptional regulator n=1 Tax=Pseudonocardia dioxanivorans TaxID=240495 RepID=UPI000CD2931D|nr:TetR/AcrR family transcriptional regulator [Pseudonocardia dioxanivorans]
MTRADSPSTRPGSPVRARILAAADRLFYGEGIRAVSADRIIGEAAVSKVTFYRHFPTKDDLVLAYVEGRSRLERDGIDALLRAHADDACAALTALAGAIEDLGCAEDFRGCPFINAAAEYPRPDHPVRQAVDRHRDWFADTVREQVTRLGVADADADGVTRQLVMLRDGAMVAGYLDGDADPSTTLAEAGLAIVDRALRDGDTDDARAPERARPAG